MSVQERERERRKTPRKKPANTLLIGCESKNESYRCAVEVNVFQHGTASKHAACCAASVASALFKQSGQWKV